MSFCAVDFKHDTPQARGLSPVISGEQSCPSGHFWGSGVRHYYLIHYVISGKGVFYCGPNKFNLCAGQIFVIFPGTVIKYQADKLDPWHYAWVGFSGDEAKDVFAGLGITPKNPVFSVKNGDELLENIRRMPAERGADLHTNLLFSARLYGFMALLMENRNKEPGRENSYYVAAKRYIKAHYFEDITVESVASHVGISRKYLFAIFKNEGEISPKEYITDYRMRRAMEFLKNAELPVGDVAYSVGYRDPLTFSKMFTQKVGMSPTAYRKTLK